jgi:hypothetical protein
MMARACKVLEAAEQVQAWKVHAEGWFQLSNVDQLGSWTFASCDILQRDFLLDLLHDRYGVGPFDQISRQLSAEISNLWTENVMGEWQCMAHPDPPASVFLRQRDIAGFFKWHGTRRTVAEKLLYELEEWLRATKCVFKASSPRSEVDRIRQVLMTAVEAFQTLLSGDFLVTTSIIKRA